MSSSKTYQRHIDGLRAVAVLSVIFYHFGQTAFGGGFVGVDVFFVISGYLITNLILDEFDRTGDFDFKRFYIRRMRRLFPALGVTLAVSMVLALALFSPERLQAFGRSLSGAVFSVSNIIFWLESGYFDADSHLKPLLHTWSLSVEEQFYLLWPALLWLAARGKNHRYQLYILIAVGLVSFGLNYLWVWGSFDDDYASTIFYLTPFRIFELVIGAMAIFLVRWYPARQWLHEFGMLLGLTLISYSVIFYTDEIIFPYYYALTPCIGALLVIMSNQARGIGWILTNRVAVGIGLISYSMYLIHWPVLVFYQYYKFTPLTQGEYIALFALTTLLSILMYFFVEKPLRKNTPSQRNPAPQKLFVLATSSAMVIIALVGMYSYMTEGSTRYNQGALSAAAVSKGHKDRFQLVRKGCSLNRLEKPWHCDLGKPMQILVIGNSHEPDGYNIFNEIYRADQTVNLISFGTLNNCNMKMGPSGPSSSASYLRCAERASMLNDRQFVSTLDAVVFSSNQPFSENSEIIWQILDHLTKLNPDLSIAVLGGFINTTRDCAELFNRFGTFDSCKDPAFIDYNPLQEREKLAIRSAAEGLDYLYIDKAELLCSGRFPQSCEIDIGKEPAFYDRHHLSFTFATMLGQRIAQAYGTKLIAAGFPPPETATDDGT